MLEMKGPHLIGLNASSAAAAAAAAVKQQKAAEQQVNGSAAAVSNAEAVAAAAANSVPSTSKSAAGVISTAAQQESKQEQEQSPTTSGLSRLNSSDPAAGKVFVGGLSWQTTAEKLQQYFGIYGNITDVIIMKHPLTQRSRGFGFITFSDAYTVDKILLMLHALDGKLIDVQKATPKSHAKLTRKIFVGGVRQDTSAEEVKAYFGQFGKVEETVMIVDHETKRHRGFGFVTLESKDVVERICNIHFHTIKNKKVECKRAQSKIALQNGLLGVGPLRMAAPASVAPASPVVAAQAQVRAAAAAVASQNAAAVVYGKLLNGSCYPGLAGYCYAPYPITAPNPARQVSPAAAGPPLSRAAGNPYQGNVLTNVNMSSFGRGVGWGSMYGMGI